MNRIIQIQFPCGDIFEIPADVVAKNYAEYYAADEGIQPGTPEWEEFLQNIPNEELEDWAPNNMDWSDVKEYATLIKEEERNYDEEWSGAEFFCEIAE